MEDPRRGWPLWSVPMFQGRTEVIRYRHKAKTAQQAIRIAHERFKKDRPNDQRPFVDREQVKMVGKKPIVQLGLFHQ